MKKYFTNIKVILLFLLGTTAAMAQNTAAGWQQLGPVVYPLNTIGQINGIARVSQVKFHPTDPKTMYSVTSMGGLFISKDEGQNWSPMGTDFIPAARCASVCIDYTDDRILYFSTGDPHYYGSNYSGIWKSTDGGKTWNQSNANIGNRTAIELLMSPLDHNTLIAATPDGIWKTTNGGASWAVKKSGGQFTDMVFKAEDNTSTIYAAAQSEFWRSTNMGETWTQVSIPGSGIQSGGRVAVSKADPNIVYLSFTGNFGAGLSTPVLKSSNSGQSFTVVKTPGLPNLNGYDGNSGGQGNYNYFLTADPTNANILWAGGHVIWKSVNGGSNWTQVTRSWATRLHTDMHKMEFSPYKANTMYNANDGGIYMSNDGGVVWQIRSDGLMAPESYAGAQSPIRKDMITIGTQDNGGIMFKNNYWATTMGGDVHVKMEHDFLSGDHIYFLSGNGRRRSTVNGSESSMNFPITGNDGNGNDKEMEFNPKQTSLGFVSHRDVYRTTNLGSNPPAWTKLTNINQQIKSIGSSPADANILYVVAENNTILRSDNALSASPTFTTYSAPGATNVRACIVGMANDANVVYASCGNRVYRSSNKGASWTNVSGTLPTVNITKIQHDRFSTNEAIYVMSALGVYYKDNSMSDWVNYSKDLPSIAEKTRLFMFNDGTPNSVIRVNTGGRGVWTRSLYNATPVLRTPENPANAISGLNYEYYEGLWNQIPNFNSLKPIKKGVANTFDISLRNREDQFGFRFKGYINAPTDGMYTFYLSSDDGAILYIGDQALVDNNGTHGDANEVTGVIGLKAGRHKISVEHFDGNFAEALSVSYAGPGIAKQAIPASALYRLPEQAVCSGTGSITYEIWTGIGGNSVSAIPVNNTPNETKILGDFEGAQDYTDNYGSRIRGFVCPPYTGNYTFWVSSDDDSELWLSTDGNPANKRKIAELKGQASQLRNWYKNPSQQSASIALIAGQKYYIESLQKDGGGDDNHSVGWLLPSGDYERPIPANRLSPYVPNAIPTVSITAPANNSTFTPLSTITITASANDNDGNITQVEFFDGGVSLGIDYSNPYSFTWNNVAAGTHELTAIATDNANGTGISAKVTIKSLTLRTPENPASTAGGLDYTYYEGSWSALPNFASLTAVKKGNVSNYDIAVRNRDDQFGFSFDGYVNVPTDGEYTFFTGSDDGSRLYIGSTLVVDNDGLHGNQERSGVIGLKAGKHAVKVVFFEQGGGEILTVQYQGPGIAKQTIPSGSLFRDPPVNQNPTVSITSPTTGTSFTSPATINIAANAGDPDGTVSKVEFFNGSNSIGSDNTSPYTLAWSGVAAGTYTLTAKVTDNSGTVVTSAAITVTVTNPPPTFATVYQHCNYDIVNGYGISVPLGSYNTAAMVAIGIKNNDISSVKVLTGYEVALYANDNFTGDSLILKADESCVVAYSFNDKASSFIVRVATVANNVLPTVSITAPVTNASYTAPASVTISANATDSDGSISKVEFYNGSSLLNTDASSPYSFNWTSVSAGTFSITAKATDDKGGQTSSSTVTITVQNPNVAPTVSITTPVNNASYTAPASFTIGANASDSDGSISKVEFYNGSTLLNTDTSSPYSFNWTNLAAGTYSITAKATDDKGGQTTSASVTVRVQNANVAPTVSITSPANNMSYTSPANITINANASDADGSISKVEFYNGTSLLNTDASSPYSFNWTNVAAGNYALTVKAYDNSSAVTTSTIVNVVVTGSSPCSGLAVYSENSGYEPGSKVKGTDNKMYECKPWPYSGWCNAAAWAYAPGTGLYWSDAWVELGACGATARSASLNDDSETASVTNYPNPFEGTTTFRVNVKTTGQVQMVLYNNKGEKVADVFSGKMKVGTQEVVYDGSSLTEGVYICKIIGLEETKVLTLTKVTRPKKQ